MKNLFKSITSREFDRIFTNDLQCLEYLANAKWENGFICRKCGNTNYCKGKMTFSRRCTKCKKEESATAHTFFHHCKLPLKEAFRIAYLVCHSPDTSSYELSRLFHTRQMTCWKFKRKIMECIEKNGEMRPL